MTAPAVSLSFFDPARNRHGTVREGVALLFEGRRSRALPAVPEIVEEGDGYRASAGGEIDLLFSPLTDPAELDGTQTRLCRVSGRAGARVDALGIAAVTNTPPAWAELDALRSLSAVFDEEHVFLALARRPRGALGHDAELIAAWLLSEGKPVVIEETRLSTVYDGEGRQRSAGIELWLEGEDFPRRLSGTALAGTSLEFDGLRVNASVFAWHMQGREGSGGYELVLRDEGPIAA